MFTFGGDKVKHLYPKGLSIEHGIFEIRVF